MNPLFCYECNEYGIIMDDISSTDLVFAKFKDGLITQTELERVLFKAYYNKLMRLCLKFLKHPDDAEDAVSDTFIKINRRVGRFTGKSSLNTWIYKIATRTCIDKARRRQQVTLVSLDESTQDVPCISGTLQSVPEYMDILAILGEISDDHRKVIILCDIAGLTMKEAALQLDCHMNTVKTRLHRGRKSMSSLLGDTYLH
jgi:RNA polymerase sigma-70 factor (ECF subfamily)